MPVSGKDQFVCHADCQEVGKYHTRGESWGTCNTYTSIKCEPRVDVTRIPRQGTSGPTKRT